MNQFRNLTMSEALQMGRKVCDIADALAFKDTDTRIWHLSLIEMLNEEPSFSISAQLTYSKDGCEFNSLSGQTIDLH
jgi:hypothetical protein